MGGPGSGRRPKLIVSNLSQIQEAAYKRFIYPAVMVDMKWNGALISSKQEVGQVGYVTYALCEVRPKEISNERVNLWMVRYEPSSEGLLSSVYSIPGTVEYVGEKVVDGYALALIKLTDDINYPETYGIYSPRMSATVEPCEDVYIVTRSHSRNSLFAFQRGIVSSISFPEGIEVMPRPEWDNAGYMVVRRKPEPELLAIMPRWQWWDLMEVGKLCMAT